MIRFDFNQDVCNAVAYWVSVADILIFRVAQKSVPTGVYQLVSVLMHEEMGFNSCFPPEPLPKTLHHLKSAVEDAFARIDDDPEICRTVFASSPEHLQQCTEHLQQCIYAEGRQFQHFR
jgi:hypothetical protein